MDGWMERERECLRLDGGGEFIRGVDDALYDTGSVDRNGS